MSARRATQGPAAPALQPTMRAMEPRHVDAVLALERECFPSIPDERLWARDELEAHVERFPEGQWVFEAPDGTLLASCTNIRTTWDKATRQHRWREITGGAGLPGHDPGGEVLYGTEIMVHPGARRMGLGRRLFERRFRHVVDEGLRAFVTGGRLPGYREHLDDMVPQEYIRRVVLGDLTDPVLTPELKWGLQPIGVLAGYIHDPDSAHYATLVAWTNPAL